MTPDNAYGSRARTQLSRARILGSALELVDQDGLEALTMRRLAEHLSVDPMSLYNYVEGKEGLLDGLAEALGYEFQVPEGEIAWKDALRAFAISLRALAHSHPQAYGLVFGRGFLPEPALRAIDPGLTALERAGLTRGQAAEMASHPHRVCGGLRDAGAVGHTGRRHDQTGADRRAHPGPPA